MHRHMLLSEDGARDVAFFEELFYRSLNGTEVWGQELGATRRQDAFSGR